MDVLRELAKQVEEQLRVDSYPLAVKLLESVEEVPEYQMFESYVGSRVCWA